MKIILFILKKCWELVIKKVPDEKVIKLSKSYTPVGRKIKPHPVEYWDILERARKIQHTFSDRSLSKAIDYCLSTGEIVYLDIR